MITVDTDPDIFWDSTDWCVIQDCSMPDTSRSATLASALEAIAFNPPG
jgi:hypothetical protein